MNDVDEALVSLQRALNEQMRRLNEEIAGYPRPIARCDVQLTKLLDERARVRRQLDRLAPLVSIGNDDRLSRIAQCLVEWEAPDDNEAESAAYDKLRATVLAITRSA